MGRTFVLIVANLREAATEALKGMHAPSLWEECPQCGRNPSRGRREPKCKCLWVGCGALVDDGLGKMPLGITQGEATQSSSTLSQWVPV